MLKGKTTRSAAAPRAPTFEATFIPPSILEHHRNVTLCADFFFVQGISFFHTIARGIGFRTAPAVTDRSKPTIIRSLRAVIKRYHDRGFAVCDVHADNELECAREALLPIELNVVPADCHVGEIERSIRTIKERLRSCVHGLPFSRLPRIMIRHLVADVVRCLNQFPWTNGISETMSPASIVTGVGNPAYGNMRLEFGSYVQVFEDNDPSNTLRARSIGAIALTPTGNAQGDYYFMSLASGDRISRHSWTPLPMTDTAIARVHALASHEKQPLIQDSGLVVEWRPDHPVDPAAYDRDFAPPGTEPHDVFDSSDYDAIDPDEVDDLLADVPYPFYDPLADAVPQGAHFGGEPGANEDGEDDDEDYGEADEDDNANDDYDDDAPDGDDNDDGEHNANDAADPFEDQGAHDANDADAHFEDQDSRRRQSTKERAPRQTSTQRQRWQTKARPRQL